MQPYNGTDISRPLSELEYLDNRDKHRALLTHNFQQLFQSEIGHPGITVTYAKSSWVEDGAYFATIQYAPDYSGVKVKPPLSLGITVKRANGLGFLIIPDFLRDNLTGAIREVLMAAEARFGAWSVLP
jgi:hypothetical protein